MLLIQQSLSFRVWTSRALMVYFRRALLFLVVSPRQHINDNNCLLQQQQQKVYFSDAEDDEDMFIINDHRKLSQALNNSMRKTIENDTTIFSSMESIDVLSSNQTSPILDFIQLPVINQFKLFAYNSNQDSNSLIDNNKINGSKMLDDSVYSSYDLYCNNTNPIPSYPSCPSCLPLSSICHSFDNETSSSGSVHQNLSQSLDDEDDIYEKYQTSFSHILHQTKSLHTICKEDKLQSMLVLEPNTSIITVRQLTYHPLNPNNIHYSMITSHICVRLIANPIDSSIQCDTKPIGCKTSLFNNIIKSTSIHNEQEEKSNLENSFLTLTDRFNHSQFSNKKLHATSILIDIPYKTLYIDS